jgi:hypothetical protein
VGGHCKPCRVVCKPERLGPEMKTPQTMSASEINKALDALDKKSSKLTNLMIDAGMGHERPTDTLELLKAGDTHPLRLQWLDLWDKHRALYYEVERRAGPGMRRLPRGFGPRT